MGRIAGVTPEETRQRLLEAAARVFAERGYEGARVTDITEAADLSSGAIYNHYKSKAALLADVIRAHGASELAGLFTDDDPKPGVADLLVMLGSALARRDPTHGALVVEAIVASRRDADVAQLMVAGVRQREFEMGELIRSAQDNGELDPAVPADIVGRFSLMLTLGSLLVGALELPAVDATAWHDFIDRMVDQFRTEETKR